MNDSSESLWCIIGARDASMANLQKALLEQQEELIRKEAAIQFLKERLQEEVVLASQQNAELEDKESTILTLSKAVTGYRLALTFNPFWIIQRFRQITTPRLGNLNQYQPRRLLLAGDTKAQMVLSNYPKVSIVTPSFAQGRYIEKTIRSILDQGYPNLEYFVQDGGSTDETIAVLKRYDQQLSGWVSKMDGGQSHAINRGFYRTSGEIMGWLNSDDLLLPGALACVVDYFNRHPDVDVVYGNRLLIDESDMEIGRWLMPCHDSKVLSWVDYVPQETLFWRRRIWEKAGGQIDESFRFAMDWDLLVRFREAGARIAHIPRFLGAFRIHQHQKTCAAINEVGYKEMDRIRERVLGRVPSRKEIQRAILPFMLKHIAVDMAYRVRTRLRRKA